MKRIVSVFLVAAVLALTLCSCAAKKPEGRYVCENATQIWLEFAQDTDTVTLHSAIGDETGTYSVDDGLIIELSGLYTSAEYDSKTEKIIWNDETYVKQGLTK